MDLLRQSWRSLLIAIAIPVVGLVLFPLTQSEHDADFLRALRRNNPTASADQLAAFHLATVCADPELSAKVAGPCRDHKALGWLARFAPAILVLTLTVPIAVYIAGQKCRRDRALLLRVFRPGLRIVNYWAAFLILSQGLLLVGELYYGFSVFLNSVPAAMMIATALGAVLGAIAVIRSMFQMSRDVVTGIAGHFATRDQAPALWTFVDEIAAATGAAPPDNVIVGLDPAFFVTQSVVVTSEGARPGRSLYLSAPLCRLLSKPELRAICAHEMGHFKGEDTEWSIRFYPIYRGAANSIGSLIYLSEENSRGTLALLPAVHVLSFFLNSFAEAESAISRDRELAADRVAVETCGADSFVTGLAKIVIHEPAWADLLNANWRAAAATAADGRETRVNASRLFVRYAEERARASEWSQLSARLATAAMPHPTDSHPPTELRLLAGGVALDQLRDRLDLRIPADPSSDLIPDLDQREERITAEIQDRVRAASAARNLTFAQLPD